MSLLQLEFLKLRRTLVWPTALFLPLVPALMNLLIHRSERFRHVEWGSVLQNGLNTWHLLLLPLVLSLLTAWLLGTEHGGGGWRLNFAAPRARPQVLAAKLLTLVLLSLVMALTALLSVGLSALSLPDLTGRPDWAAFALGGLRGWLGSAGLLTLLFLVALRFSSFLAPVGVGMAGMVIGFMGINSPAFGPWWPWTFPTLLGMLDGGTARLTLPALLSVGLCAACLALSVWEVRQREA